MYRKISVLDQVHVAWSAILIATEVVSIVAYFAEYSFILHETPRVCYSKVFSINVTSCLTLQMRQTAL